MAYMSSFWSRSQVLSSKTCPVHDVQRCFRCCLQRQQVVLVTAVLSLVISTPPGFITVVQSMDLSDETNRRQTD